MARNALDVILAELAPLAGRSVLDVGCGKGGLAAPLGQAGAIWRGLDPAPGSTFLPIDIAPAEAMPYADASFDAAICVNALHHVPVPAMDRALAEIARVLRPEGRLVVIEPRATGALSQVIAVVDDETRIRAAAQAAMDRATALMQVGAHDYDRVERYPDFAAFCDSLIAVDPDRGAAIAGRRGALRDGFHAQAGRVGDVWTLGQPMSVRLFRPTRGVGETSFANGAGGR